MFSHNCKSSLCRTNMQMVKYTFSMIQVKKDLTFGVSYENARDSFLVAIKPESTKFLKFVSLFLNIRSHENIFLRLAVFLHQIECSYA